jgi:hypothetical protein
LSNFVTDAPALVGFGTRASRAGSSSARARQPHARGVASVVRTADPWRDTDVIDSRAPRTNQAVVGTCRLSPS